ncbi:MAG: hypothetical protein H6673_07250 [Anaerolineales bacterium]|nr:hypothetical protein [Anaerolineales bacterium]
MRIISILLLFIPLGLATIVHAQGTPDICIRAFEDTNQNGLYDAGEPSLAGVSVFVKQGEAIVGSLTTTPDDDCLLNLAAGDYTVEFESPFNPTTPTSQSVTLDTERVIIDYGAMTTTEAPTADTAASSAPQPLGNQICVVVFEDSNINGLRDENEGLIAGVDVQLTANDVIINTLLTSDNDYSCFAGLTAGAYRVLVPPSPHHQMTTQADFAPTFIGVGTDVKAEFGAQRVEAFTADALLPNLPPKTDNVELDQETRLLLAAFGATVALMLMMGIGAIVIWFLRR